MNYAKKIEILAGEAKAQRPQGDIEKSHLEKRVKTNSKVVEVWLNDLKKLRPGDPLVQNLGRLIKEIGTGLKN